MKKSLLIALMVIVSVCCAASHKYSAQEIFNLVYEANTLGVHGYSTQEVLNAVFDDSDNTIAVNLSGGDAEIGQLSLTAATELTISSDSIAVTQSAHTLRGEGSADDDLETISGGSVMDILVLYPATPDTSDITIKNGTGNILTSDGNDYTIPDNGFVLLIYTGTNWLLFSGGGTSFPLENGEWATWEDSNGVSANVITLNSLNEIVLGQEAKFGLHEFVPNSGYVPALDMQITSAALEDSTYGYYFAVDSTKFITVSGKANASGGIDTCKVSVPVQFTTGNPSAYAYVSVSDTTVTSTVGTRYPVQATFTNSLSNFTAVTNGIRFDGGCDQTYYIWVTVSAIASVPNVNTWLGIEKNGTIVSGSEMQRELGNGAYGSWTVITEVDLAFGDVVTITYRTDTAGAIITTQNMQTIAIPKP